MQEQTIMEIKDLTICFDDKKCIENINLKIKQGKIYSIIGPNGCGKTTLIRAMSRSIKPSKGKILLENEDIFKIKSKQVAQKMATLYQTNETSSDITVKSLVQYGRFVHREWWKGVSREDREIAEWAIEKTGLQNLQDRKINTLSGGERQRAWIAMSIAQKPKVFILDEPTTYLDISHQLEILELINRLNQEEGITVIMVLHDINHAARYSQQVIVIKESNIYKAGPPLEVIDNKLLRQVFQVEAEIFMDKENEKPLYFPRNSVVR